MQTKGCPKSIRLRVGKCAAQQREITWRGFTLLELMVVLGVITLLAALLLPALSKAREAAWKCRCKGNLRQLGFALKMYVDDFHSYPVFGWPTAPNGLSGDVRATYWDSKLLDYLAINKRLFVCPGVAGEFQQPEVNWSCTITEVLGPIAATATTLMARSGNLTFLCLERSIPWD